MNTSGIVQHPDPILRTRCAPADLADEQHWRVAETLIRSCREPGRAGVAAPQIGINLRAFAANLRGGVKVFFNPVVTTCEGDQSAREGCLSVAERWFHLTRPFHVVVMARDVQGKQFIYDACDLEARILCHEIDHLDGILVLDRARQQMPNLPRQQRRSVERELAKIEGATR